MAESKNVTVINRTQFEITVDTATVAKGKFVRKPIKVERNGEPIEACDITLPGTPRHSLTPSKTVFKKSDWAAIEDSAAIKGMIAQGQIEVR